MEYQILNLLDDLCLILEKELKSITENLQEIKGDIKEVKVSQVEIQEKVVNLGKNDLVSKLVEDKVNVLNKRVYEVETKIQRITREK